MEREQFLSDLQFQQILSIINNKGANQSSNPKANAAGTSSNLSQAPMRLRRLILDSGATDHITSSPNLLVNSRQNTILPPVIMPSGEQAPITSTGTLPLNSVISLKNVLGVPSFKVDLMSDLTTKTTIGWVNNETDFITWSHWRQQHRALNSDPPLPLLAIHLVLMSRPPLTCGTAD
ncbi:unnamed protein product [Prunus armeniaca]